MKAFLVAGAVSVAATPLVIAMARRWSLIDEPNHRSSHVSPVPRGGGLAVAVATLVGVTVGGGWSSGVAGLAVGATVLGLTGLIDDRFGVPPAPRLAVQVVMPIAVALLVADYSGIALLLAAVVAAIAVAAWVNAFNFMDGINGISASQALIIGVFLAALADSHGRPELTAAGAAVAGASLGFLAFNAIGARIFLGDVGSYFLGFWLAGLALLVAADESVLVVLGPFLLYLGDTATVLFRRARRGERLTIAHREHAYQRLTQAGWSHFVVAMLCATISAVAAAVMYVVRESSMPSQVAAFFACMLLVVGYLLLPDLVTRSDRTRRMAT